MINSKINIDDIKVEKINFIKKIKINKKKIKKEKWCIKNDVPAPGLEPGPRERQNFKSCMSTNSIIRVHINVLF